MTYTNKPIHPNVKKFPYDECIVGAKDIYELGKQWNCSPEEAWNKIKNNPNWIIGGYNNFDQECYIKVEE